MKHTQHEPVDDDVLVAFAADLIEAEEQEIVLPDPLTIKRTITGTPMEIRVALASWTKEVNAHIAQDTTRCVTVTISVT